MYYLKYKSDLTSISCTHYFNGRIVKKNRNFLLMNIRHFKNSQANHKKYTFYKFDFGDNCCTLANNDKRSTTNNTIYYTEI